ncbi:MAG: RNA polymerase sigma factor [Kordiimonadaceae bacterium]|nr:RNA polymerase sigma factor [Kordiimonadaceae bacterium]MBO6569575.1 RNA polymerase sigma factor [Kordiimonadaceae bacterium]
MSKPSASAVWKQDLVDLLPRLRRYALSLTGSVTDAEDLLHSTVERVLAKADQFEDGTNLDRWVFRVCKNLWFDEWRQRKVRGPTMDPTEARHEPSTDGESHAENRIQLRELSNALQQLQEEQREILVQVVIEGHSYKEVAAMLDVPIGTVMSRLARARAKLASILPNPNSGNVQ